MPGSKTPLVIGFITLESNEINMLKSIVRVARQNRAGWRLVCLKAPETDMDEPQIERHLQSLRTLCVSLGGDFAYVDNPVAPDFFKISGSAPGFKSA